MKDRVLKIQEVGDFYRKQTRPQIMLSGKWLEQMGFSPDSYVKVTHEAQGRIVLEQIKQEVSHE